MGGIEALGKASVIRMGVRFLALAVCCGFGTVGLAASNDASMIEPQLSADQNEWPLTDITETTDANDGERTENVKSG